MKKIMRIAAALVLGLSLVATGEMAAQTTRSSGSTGSSTRSSQSTGSSTRSSQSTGSASSRSSASSSSSRSSSSIAGSSAVRSSSGSSSVRSSASSSTRSSGTSTVRSSSGSSSVRSSASSSSSTRSSASSSSRSSSGSSSGTSVRSSASSGTTVSSARSSNVSREGLGVNASSGSSSNREVYRDGGGNYRYSDDFSLDNNHNISRVAPRHREPTPWDKPGHFWGDKPHYYGYRVHSLPPSWRRISHWGIDYYYYNGIYYRSYGSYYVICRPPFGTPLEATIDRAILRSIRFAYYCDTYRTYSRAFDNYNIIARQNLIIAQQNARIAARNAAYALNSNRALTAYELAEKLGLVQSFAYANSEYFYQDGVFYTISSSGIYSTIIPPAGALVTSLPDDYEIIVLNGIEYYMVDNTVYRTTLFEGQPYLEVLGQMYGSLYNQYNIYR